MSDFKTLWEEMNKKTGKNPQPLKPTVSASSGGDFASLYSAMNQARQSGYVAPKTVYEPLQTRPVQAPAVKQQSASSYLEQIEAAEQQKLLGIDTSKGRQDIAALEGDLQLFEELTNFRNSYRDYLDNGGEQARDMDTQSKLAQYNQLAKKYGDVDALKQQIAALNVQTNKAERAQRADEMSGVVRQDSANYDADFAAKSAYESTATPTTKISEKPSVVKRYFLINITPNAAIAAPK